MQQASGSVTQSLMYGCIHGNPSYADLPVIHDTNPNNNPLRQSELTPDLPHLLDPYYPRSSEHDSEHEDLNKLSKLLTTLHLVKGICYTSIALYLHNKYLSQCVKCFDSSSLQNALFSPWELKQRTNFFLHTVKSTPQLHVLLGPNVTNPPPVKVALIHKLPALAWFVSSIYNFPTNTNHPLYEELLQVRNLVLSKWQNFHIKSIMYIAHAFIKLQAEMRNPYFMLFVIQQISPLIDAATNTAVIPNNKPYSLVPNETGSIKIISWWSLYNRYMDDSGISSSSSNSLQISAQPQSLLLTDSISSEVLLPESESEIESKADIGSQITTTVVAASQVVYNSSCAHLSSRKSKRTGKKRRRSHSAVDSDDAEDDSSSIISGVSNFDPSKTYDFDRFLGCGFKSDGQIRFWVKWPDNIIARYSPDAQHSINWVNLSAADCNYAPLARLITDLWNKVHQYEEHYKHDLVQDIPPGTD
jgi:hypothetical protein